MHNTAHFELRSTKCMYTHFAFSARNPGRVSLPEFPTSATVYVTVLSNDQIMPIVESFSDLGSFTISQMNAPCICTNTYTGKVRRGCERRHMPEAAYVVGAHDNDDQMQRKGRSKHVNYFLKYL